MKCPKCASENKDDAPFCAMCYEPFRKEKRERPTGSAAAYSAGAAPEEHGSGKKLTGWGIIIAILMIGGFIAVKFHLGQITVKMGAKKVLKARLVTECFRELPLNSMKPGKMSEKELEQVGEKVSDTLKKIDRIEIKSISALGRGVNIVVRAEILVDGKVPAGKKRVRYFRMKYSTLTGWRYKRETTASSYYLNIF
ncbi:hypothetical protein ACFL6Y_09180 [Elusimicrobiota bacterium]